MQTNTQDTIAESISGSREARRLWLEIAGAVDAYTSFFEKNGFLINVTIEESSPVPIKR